MQVPWWAVLAGFLLFGAIGAGLAHILAMAWLAQMGDQMRASDTPGNIVGGGVIVLIAFAFEAVFALAAAFFGAWYVRRRWQSRNR